LTQKPPAVFFLTTKTTLFELRYDTAMSTCGRLKDLLARRVAVTVPGVANALLARVVEDIGFEAVYVTGAGVANMLLGVPDLGLTTMTEISETVAAIADVTSLPIIVDADTGYGNAVNCWRTVRVLERAGASGIQIEDQVFPKKCGHFATKAVIAKEEMVQKIKAAVDARHDPLLQIIARTDARAMEGLERALDRAEAYIAAGADATFVEAPTDLEELARIPQALHVPQVANIVFGGKTPDPGRDKLTELGFSIVLYANAALQAALKASYDVLRALKSEGSLRSVADRLASFEQRQHAVAKEKWDARETRYRV
jgi:2-methylisocitrate lyase-like PEP mutase family enzyme